MRRFRFPIAVAVTSLGLVLVLIGLGGLVVRNALASGSPFGGPGVAWVGGRGGPWRRHAR